MNHPCILLTEEYFTQTTDIFFETTVTENYISRNILGRNVWPILKTFHLVNHKIKVIEQNINKKVD